MTEAHWFFDDTGMLRSGEFGDIYFSNEGALEETRHVFLDGNHLRERLPAREEFTVAEAGFGTGLNFLATLQFKQAVAHTCSMTYFAFELYPLPEAVLRQVYRNFPELEIFAESFLRIYRKNPPKSGINRYSMPQFRFELILVVGDIRQTAQTLNRPVDAWYLDGFSPQCNSDMWGAQLFEAMRKHTVIGGTAATYSCARAVRENFDSHGFTWQKTPGFGNKRYMLQAALDANTPG